MIGERIYWFDVLSSTNDYALSNHSVLHDGDVIVALEQTHGRGRHGREWHSPRGGLWFTVVFKPKKNVDPNFHTKLTSVSLVKTLEDLEVRATIKWPNDILVSKKKLAGLLTEGIYQGRVPLIIAVGIGMNVNNEIPEHLKDRAVSLKEILKKTIPIEQLLGEILRKMRTGFKKYVRAPGALTRIWKKYLNIRKGDVLNLNGESYVVENIEVDRIIVRRNGERFEILDTPI